MVVVKVGKPTERSKPGNRGKRDSQILLMHYLNRVHFDAPMSPLELEVYHQMRNVIGIDPAFYEYIFTVDADTVRNFFLCYCSADHDWSSLSLSILYRLLPLPHSIDLLRLVRMIQVLLEFVVKPNLRTKKVHGGL